MVKVIIFHYHFFKNAGTSVDAVLERNFGERWVTREFAHRPAAEHAQEVAAWVQGAPGVLAFSSHTAELPPPRVDGSIVFPIVFLRHPIDRVASVYAFERQQLQDPGWSSVLAKNTTLAGYVQVRLSMAHDRQCRNFHVARLARMFEPDRGTEFERAHAALHTLPFVGIVEEFDASLRRLKDLIEPEFPEFQPMQVAENTTRRPDQPLAVKLAEIEAELGPALYQTLNEVNRDDLALYEEACRLAH